MKIKKYRAATMREALEKVKQDLGEDALVLSTKQIKAGGIMGFGSTTQVEVSVSDDAFPTQRAPQTPGAKKASTSGLTGLHLTDGDSITPADAAGTRSNTNAFTKQGARNSQTMAALAARSYVTEPGRFAAQSASRSGLVKDAIELSPSAPRIVHRRQAPQASVNTAPIAAPEPARKTSGAGASEMDRLRAEMREVKFSLGAFANRQMAAATSSAGIAPAFESTPELYDSPRYEIFMDLVNAGLDAEHARSAALAGGVDAEGVDAFELGRRGLLRVLPSLVQFAADPLLASASPVITLIGATGVGKTTTLAKLAARVALRERRRVELITLDTYRIAAVEQLKTYAEIIGAGCHVVRSVLELDALTRRLSADATVLIDTAGRSPHDLADQMELADYLRSNEDILKCLVVQATTHTTDAMIAVRKFALYGANRLVITKLDETTRPGAAINLAAEAKLPLAYICAGQRVPEDIELATAESCATHVMRAPLLAAA